jgi:hypothetical protein
LKALIEDQRKIELRVGDGVDIEVSEFAHKLRLSLFRELFGIADCDDPLSLKF